MKLKKHVLIIVWCLAFWGGFLTGQSIVFAHSLEKRMPEFIEFIEATTDVDFGTIVSPSDLTVDLGEI